MEALILKGGILADLKKYEDAAVHFREAMQVKHMYKKVITSYEAVICLHVGGAVLSRKVGKSHV